MSILITGGAGYIGSHVCVQLLLAGHEIVVFDNFRSSHPEAVRQVEQIAGCWPIVVEGDIRDQAAIEAALRQFECKAVIHFAGLKAVGESVEKPLTYYDDNAVGTHRRLMAMQNCGVGTLVFSSSATVYGEPQRLPLTEDHPLSATNPDGRSKLIIEDMQHDLCRENPDWHLMPFVAQVAAGAREYLSVWGSDYPTHDGTGVRDYIHVVYLALDHLKALERFVEPQCAAINLGTGVGFSMLDVVNAFEEASGRRVPYQLSARRSGDVAACYAAPTLAEQLLGWKAQRDLAAMCRDHWCWQKQNPQGYV